MQVEMRIQGLMRDPFTNVPLLVLRDPKTDAMLPLWIGIHEAYAISLELEHVTSPRPMTHDLFRDTLRALDARVERIVITHLEESTFYAVIEITSAGGNRSIDARPSDAIALALRFEAPIFATERVIKDAENIDITDGYQDSKRYRAWLEGLDRTELGEYEI